MQNFDLVVIGGGPGGYVAAIRAAQLGWNVACIDANALLGGTCLRVGCIPSKALLESSHHYAQLTHGLEAHGIRCERPEVDLAKMQERKHDILRTLARGTESLLKKNKIERFEGHGRLDGPGRVTVEPADGEPIPLETAHILLATGSQPASLPGIEPDGRWIGTSTEALAYDEVPQRLVVIGAGYIGLELGSVWNRLGSKVTVLEALDRILPGTDAEIAADAQKIFAKQGLEFRLSTRVQGVTTKKSRSSVEVADGEPIRCDRVLLAVGRKPHTDRLGLETVDIQVDERGRIPVDDTFRTSAEGVFAIGDCIGGPMLAHKASEEGIACIERLITGHGHVDYNLIPGIVYTDPEIATVGRTEEQLKDDGIEYRRGVFPFRGNGRARTLGQTDGRVKVLADQKTDRILGVHIIGPRAGDLIAEAVAAMAFGASSEDLARVCHGHPTLSEALHEAALAVDGRAIHG